MEQMMEQKGRSYKLAGWLSIISAVLGVPLTVLTVIQMLSRQSKPVMAPLGITLLCVVVVFGLYAFYKFKELLNEKYGFHRVDTLVLIVIIGSILIAVERILFRLVFPSGMIPLLVLLFITGIPLSIVGIVFAVRLMELPDNLNGMLKPLAYTYMVACVLFLSIILSDLGHLAVMVFHVLLGIVLIRSAQEPDPEFV